MPEASSTQAKTEGSNQHEHRAKQPKPVLAGSAPSVGDSTTPLMESIGSGFGEAAFQRHSALLGDPRMAHPANTRQRALLVRQLQRDYGNQYAQRLVEQMKVARAWERTDPAQVARQAEEVAEGESAAPPVAPPVNAVAQQVWDASPAIHSQFGNDVREFERRTQQQWDAHPVRHHWNRDIDQYRGGYPAYFGIGMTNPARWAHENIVWVPFLDRRINIHRDLQGDLASVQGHIPEAILAGLVHHGGFVPRTVRGSTALSHHSVGRAVDVNAAENPRLLDLVGHNADRARALCRVIEVVTGIDLLTTTDYRAQRVASSDFQAHFNAAWVNEQQAELARRREAHRANASDAGLRREYQSQSRLVQDIRRVRGALNRLARTGFLNLQQEVIDAFSAEDFEWGGEWGLSKDYMHFEKGVLGP